MGFADRLKYWLKMKYGNMNKAASALSVASITLHRYITGENAPGTPFLIKLREVGCDINWLLGEDGELPNKIIMNQVEKLIKENAELKSQIINNQKIINSVRKQLSTLNKKKNRF